VFPDYHGREKCRRVDGRLILNSASAHAAVPRAVPIILAPSWRVLITSKRRFSSSLPLRHRDQEREHFFGTPSGTIGKTYLLLDATGSVSTDLIAS